MIRRLVLARAAVGGIAFAILLPGVALGHQLNAAYTSRLPLAVYLASSGSDFMTGQTIFLDGGQTVA